MHGSAIAASAHSFQEKGGTVWRSNKFLHPNMPEFESPPEFMLLQRKLMAVCGVSFRILFSKNFCVPYEHVPTVSMYLDL